MQPDFQEEWLTAYLDDELDDDQSEVVRQRLANDPSARQMLEDLKRVRQLVGALPGWSGGALQRQSTSSAPAVAVTVDRKEDERFVTPNFNPNLPQSNLWRKWLGACAMAASILILVGLAWRTYLSTDLRSTVAMQSNQPAASQGASAATAEIAQPMLDAENFAAAKSPSSLSLPNSPAPALAAQSADALDRPKRTTETLLADLSNERLNASRGSAPEGGGRSIPAPTAPAVPGLANAIEPAPVRESLELRGAENKPQENAGQLAILPKQTRLGRSQAWHEQDASLALSQLARLLAPAAAKPDSFSPLADGKSQVGARFSQSREKESQKQASTPNEVQPYNNEKLNDQQQWPVALLQVESGSAYSDKLFADVVANYQLVPIPLSDVQLRDLSLVASADAKVAAGSNVGKPLLSSQPKLAEGLNLRGADEKLEPAKLGEDRRQAGQSKAAPSQGPQAQTTPLSSTIILFVTRREAHQIVAAIPTIGKDSAKSSADEAKAHVNTAWWLIPAGTPANQPENDNDKVILLLNPRP